MAEDAGLVWVNSKITRPSEVTPDEYLDFYANSHVPDVVKVPGFKSAAVYKASAPEAERPFLILYRMSDMKASDSEELHELFGQEDVMAMREKGNFDIREYEPVRGSEGGDVGSKPGRVLYTMEGATLDEAGRNVPEKIVSGAAHRWSRSYKLLSAQERGEGASDSKPPAYLTLHEFNEQAEWPNRGAASREFMLVKHC